MAGGNVGYFVSQDSGQLAFVIQAVDGLSVEVDIAARNSKGIEAFALDDVEVERKALRAGGFQDPLADPPDILRDQGIIEENFLGGQLHVHLASQLQFFLLGNRPGRQTPQKLAED
jgi:hypothetical protein